MRPGRRQRLARCWVLKARARAHLRGPVRRTSLTTSTRPGPFLVDEPRRIFAGVTSGMRRRRHCREGDRPYVENYTVDASILKSLRSQVFKGTRWMPWHQEPKKDVGICDKPRGVDNQTVIRGFPNGETRLEASPVTLA